MIPIDFTRVELFAAVPRGRWASFKDVATAGGNERAPQAIGGWLRRDGDKLPHVHVLTIDGLVPEGFRPAGPKIPRDDHGVRTLLKQEGVRLNARDVPWRASVSKLSTGDAPKPLGYTKLGTGHCICAPA